MASNWADIIGTEPYVVNASRGLTVGGWFQVSSIAAVNILMAKWGVTAPLADNRSYLLQTTAAGLVQFSISRLGTAATVVSQASTSAISGTWEWFFAVGRFYPGTRIYMTLNEETSSAATGTASIFDSDAPFEVGIWDNRDVGGAGGWLSGLCSMMFMCASCLTDGEVQALFDATRPMYGVRL